MSVAASPALSLFEKDSLVKGRPARLQCVELMGQTYTIRRGPVTVLELEDEWYEDIADPAAVIDALRAQNVVKADVFTFWQRWPSVEPLYAYRQRWDEIAVLPTTSYDDWWNHQIKSRVRSQIRKAEKDGVVVRETAYDDAFVRGMTKIFNESPVRQGRPFWHYGKSEATVKEQFSRYIHREHMIGAYCRDELIGFIMLGNAGRYGVTGQILSSLAHRDKATTTALVAKAVEVCGRLGLESLIYLYWSHDSLSEFKRRCGFKPVRVPRYVVPLTPRGQLGLRLGLDAGWRAALPAPLLKAAKGVRSRWYERAQGSGPGAGE